MQKQYRLRFALRYHPRKTPWWRRPAAAAWTRDSTYWRRPGRPCRTPGRRCCLGKWPRWSPARPVNCAQRGRRTAPAGAGSGLVPIWRIWTAAAQALTPGRRCAQRGPLHDFGWPVTTCCGEALQCIGVLRNALRRKSLEGFKDSLGTHFAQ